MWKNLSQIPGRFPPYPSEADTNCSSVCVVSGCLVLSLSRLWLQQGTARCASVMQEAGMLFQAVPIFSPSYRSFSGSEPHRDEFLHFQPSQ